MTLLIAIVVGIVLWLWWNTRRVKRKVSGLLAEAVLKVNESQGTKFSLANTALVMPEPPRAGGFASQCLLFDPDALKICILHNFGKSAEVIPFTYFRSWKITWEELIAGNEVSRRNYRIVFETTDLARPLLEVPFGSDGGAAERWMAKLNTLFGGPIARAASV